MDRSQMRLVQTNDRDTRLAFKAKLASQIDAVQVETMTEVPSQVFNGVAVGGILVHPSLGEGVLVEVDHNNNEIIIDFGANGTVGLIMSKAAAFVHAPVKPEARRIDDAFFGGEIQSRMSTRSDLLHQPLDFEKIISPDFIDSVHPVPYAVGDNLWHPDLGACTVVSLDQKNNEVVLNSVAIGEVSLALSQVLSKLIPASSSPEHVRIPVKPLQLEGNNTFLILGSKDLSLQLPNEFKKWTNTNQFAYLTRNQHLTTDEANDVFAHLTGKNLRAVNSVMINWYDPTSSAEVVRKEVVAEILPDTHVWMTGRKVWHLDLGACTVVSLDSKFMVLDFPDKGQIEMVRSLVQPRLSLTEVDRLDRASDYQPAFNPLPKEPAPAKIAKDLSVILPPVFKTWKLADQFKFLTRNQHLTTEEANDVFAVLDGKPTAFAGQVSISWVDPEVLELKPEPVAVPERVSPYAGWIGKQVWHLDLGVCTVLDLDEKSNNVVLDFPSIGKLDMALSYVQPRLSLTEVKPLDRALKHKPPVAPPAQITEEKTPRRLAVVLPPAFKAWPSFQQYSYLTTEKKLTPEEAQDVLSILSGARPVTKTVFQIDWDENADLEKIEAANRHLVELAAVPVKEVVAPRSVVDLGVTRVVEEVEVIKKEVASITVSVSIPPTFKTWSASDQYLFLSRTKHLTADESNDVIDILQGKQPRLKNVLFEITWDEGPGIPRSGAI